jgi:hypothetical protein
MAASTMTTGFPVPISALAPNVFSDRLKRRRSISPHAGHALEILGHSIEYLTDEFIHEGGTFSANNSQLQAVQLLMALNREIYLECPEVPPLGRRLRAFLHFKAN